MSDEIDRVADSENGKVAFFREFEKLRPDLMYSEGWSESERDEAVEYLRPARVKTGMLSTIPMFCRGEECAFAQSCPLLKKGLAPVGKSSCPIEMAYVQQFFYDYIRELEVDVDRMAELSIVRDLVDQEIQHIRKTWLLSQEHFIQENVVGIDQDGKVITKKELHQAVEYEDRILKRKEKLRNALLATRESKAKVGQNAADSAQILSSIMDEFRQVELEEEKARRKALGLEEVDDYIVEAELVEEETEEEGS